MLYFRFFENSLECFCFCLIIALFDYHCTQVLCEVEEQATCMSMSPSWLSNSGLTKIILILVMKYFFAWEKKNRGKLIFIIFVFSNYIFLHKFTKQAWRLVTRLRVWPLVTCLQVARIVSFAGRNSYIALAPESVDVKFEMTMKFKTTEKDGLLFYTSDESASHVSGNLTTCLSISPLFRQSHHLSVNLTLVCQSHHSSVNLTTRLSITALICQSHHSSVNLTTRLSISPLICQSHTHLSVSHSSVNHTTRLSISPLICQSHHSSVNLTLICQSHTRLSISPLVRQSHHLSVNLTLVCQSHTRLSISPLVCQSHTHLSVSHSSVNHSTRLSITVDVVCCCRRTRSRCQWMLCVVVGERVLAVHQWRSDHSDHEARGSADSSRDRQEQLQRRALALRDDHEGWQGVSATRHTVPHNSLLLLSTFTRSKCYMTHSASWLTAASINIHKE